MIDLTGATLGILLDYLIDSGNAKDVYPTVLKGCTYSLIHQTDDLSSRIEWLKKGTTLSRHTTPDKDPCYRKDDKPYTQPYQQVADAVGRAGKDADSRAVLWGMNEAANGTNVPGTAGRTKGRPSRALKSGWNWFEDATIGYGYRPGLAALWLLVLWAVGGISFGLKPPVSTSSNPWDMSIVEHITYPLDLMIPILGFGEQSHWRPVGIWPQILAVLLIGFGWIFSITVLAAVTRIARRN